MAIFNRPEDFNEHRYDPSSFGDVDELNLAASADEIEDYVPIARSLSVPRARRQLKQLRSDLQQAKFNLHLLVKGERFERTPLLIDALVSAATDLQLPLDESEQINARRNQANAGKFDNRAQLADDELDAAILAATSGLGALDVASVLDEQIPPEWSNLPPLDLARKLTRLGHSILRGRIPGMNV